MKDIVAVEWLPLAAAVRRLSYPLEKLFLRNVGRRILKRRRRKSARRKASRRKAAGRSAKRHRVKRRNTQSAVARALNGLAAIPPQVLPKFNSRGGAAKAFPNAPFTRAFTRKMEPCGQDERYRCTLESQEMPGSVVQ